MGWHREDCPEVGVSNDGRRPYWIFAPGERFFDI